MNRLEIEEEERVRKLRARWSAALAILFAVLGLTAGGEYEAIRALLFIGGAFFVGLNTGLRLVVHPTP